MDFCIGILLTQPRVSLEGWVWFRTNLWLQLGANGSLVQIYLSFFHQVGNRGVPQPPYCSTTHAHAGPSILPVKGHAGVLPLDHVHPGVLRFTRQVVFHVVRCFSDQRIVHVEEQNTKSGHWWPNFEPPSRTMSNMECNSEHVQHVKYQTITISMARFFSAPCFVERLYGRIR